MDSDADESLDDFKTPEDFSVKEKQASAKLSRIKVRSTKNAEENLQETKPLRIDSKVQPLSSKVNQKKRTREKVISPAKDEASLSSVEKKEFGRCPTCGKIFRITEIIEHASACLRENFAVRKGSQKSMFSHSDAGSVTSADSDAEPSDKSFLCVYCRCDLTAYSADQKNLHINKCMDDLKKAPVVKRQKLAEKKVSQSVNCPFCLKIVTQRGLNRHLVACQKKNKFPTLQKKKPRSKRKQEVIIPLMITLSPNSKRQQLEHRLRNITHPESFHDDDEIPSTPVLPATSLTLSNVSLISNLQSRQAVSDDERPGTSGIITGFDRGNMLSDNQSDEEKDVPRCSSSITRTWPSASSTRPCDDELQSPEVSSSNMKSNASFESSGNVVPSGSDVLDIAKNASDVQQGNVDGLAQKTPSRSLPLGTKWTLTKSPTPTRPLYHVPGLLSQFDESKKKIMATLSERSDEMNSTLTTLNTLDKESEEQDNGSTDIRRDTGRLDLNVSEQNDSPQKHAISSQPVASFVKLIDNPQFSDAKILAGHNKEVIYLHKNILFCCCPLLLEEIIGCDNDELHLEEYEKSAILPLIGYIYSRRIESLVTAVSAEYFPRTTQLMEKFGVTLTHCHKKLLDAAMEGKNRCEKITSPSKANNDDANAESQHVSSNLEGESGSSFDKDSVSINQCKDSYDTSPLSSLLAPTVFDQQAFHASDDVLYPGSYEKSFIEETANVPSFSTSVANSTTLEGSVEVSPLRGITSPSTGKDRNDHPAKHKKRNKAFLDTRKSLRQFTNNRKRHSNWKTRRCHCCNEDKVHSEDKLPRFQDICRPLDKQKHLKKRRCKLHEAWKKKACVNSPKKEQKALSPARYWSKFSSERLSNVVSPRHKRYLKRTSIPKPFISKKSISSPKPVSKHNENREILLSRRTRSNLMDETEVVKPHRSVVTDSSCELKQSSDLFVQNETPRPSQSINEFHFHKENEEDAKVDSQDPMSRRDKSGMTKAHMEDELHRYVTERLPRFKQREYIKNRPGVANMGKTSGRMQKLPKKSAVLPVKIEPSFEESKLQDHIPSKNEIQPCFYSDEEMTDDKFTVDRSSSVVLSSYAFPSPKSFKNKEIANLSTSAQESDTASSSLSDIFLDSPFRNELNGTPSAVKLYPPSTPPTVKTSFERSQHDQRFQFSNPVLITPMPNFKAMPTPELLQRAKDIGLKQRIGKLKIRAKLEEVFLYQHQVSSRKSATEEDEVKEDKSADEDDLRISNVDGNSTKLKLSEMSALSSNSTTTNSVYSFSSLAKEQVLGLSTAVVDAMHSDGSLLKALQEMEEKTGSIKRGSRQDQNRCWAMVTPGSSGYNVKLDAILRLPEDYISAITTPFVACVVKYYIELKKYQFDCLPAVCDRMEELFRISEGETETNFFPL